MNVEQTKIRTLILILSVLFASLFIGYFFLKFQIKTLINNSIQNQYKSVQQIFSMSVKNENLIFDLELQKIIALPGLSKALLEQNPQEIDRIVSESYARLKVTYPHCEMLTFYSNHGITLYRAHNPQIHGDKVNHQRKIITDTYKFKKSLSGFEIGELGINYYMTQPLFYEDKYIGSVEAKLSPVYFINRLKTHFNIQAGLILKHSSLDAMSYPLVVNVDSTYSLMSSDEKLKSFFLANNKVNKNLFFTNEPLIVKSDIALLNHSKETVAHLMVGFETKKMIQETNLVIYKLFGLMLIVILISIYILHRGFEKILYFFTQRLFTDTLTGLKNRLSLNKLLEQNKNHILILSDIKDFSIINEFYGVKVGNEVLKKVALEFNKFAHKHGFSAFHIGGDEYALYKVEEFFDAEQYNDILESLHHDINKLQIHIDDLFDTIRVDINSGIVFDAIDSLEKAQMALKKTKASSASYLAYTKQVDTKERSEDLLQMRHSIRYALEHKNVVPFFQPITNAQGETTKYESLIRIVEFKNGIKEVLGPDSFLEIAKQNGFYVEIANRMIVSSLSFFKNKSEKISININPSDLFNISITDTLIKNIKNFDIPKNIVIEITEQESIEDFERLVHAIKMLRHLGVLIAIDDFGSGYANYAHILAIKPDYLKIDGSLIKNILTDADSRILVKSIVSFAKELAIITIAEYVENEDIYKILREYGVDEYQGYYFGKPQNLIEGET